MILIFTRHGPPAALRGVVPHTLFNKGTVVPQPAPAYRSPLAQCPPYYFSQPRSTLSWQSGVQMKIFVSTQVQTRGMCPTLPRLPETIRRHLLAADCSGRFLLLPLAFDTAIWPVEGVTQVSMLWGEPASQCLRKGRKSDRKQTGTGSHMHDFSHSSLWLTDKSYPFFWPRIRSVQWMSVWVRNSPIRLR